VPTVHAASKCGKCGAEVTFDDNVCANCGFAFSTERGAGASGSTTTMTHSVAWYILRVAAFVSWTLSAIALLVGIGFLVEGGVGHGLSGGGGLLIMGIPAALLFMVGMLCFRVTRPDSRGETT
jgi:hypothetical protein